MASNFTTANLPKPVITQPLDFEATYQLRLGDFIQRMKAAGIDYDVGGLETDPAVIAAQAAAYGDMYYVARLNDMAQVVLLASFAENTDLDKHAVRAGLTRGEGEDDASLRERIRLAYKGKSAAGADDYYKSKARNTDTRVKDVAITASTRDASDRILTMYVLTNDNGGLAGQELIDKLEAALNDPTFRQRSVTVEVEPAVITTKPVVATVYLYEQAIEPQDGGKALRDAFAADQRLGFDLTDSYVKKYLHCPGAQRVELHGWTDAIAAKNEAVRLGTVAVDFLRVAL